MSARFTFSRSRAVATAVLTVAAIVVGSLAWIQQGYSSADIRLNDASVWVTNGSQLLLGRLNRQIEELSTSLASEDTDIDVVQAGSVVLLHDRGQSTIAPVDVAYAALGAPVTLPAGADIRMGGSTLAVLEPTTGRVWVTSSTGMSGFSADSTKPVVTGGAGAAIAVGTDGTTFIAAPAQHAVLAVTPGGKAAAEPVAGLDDLPADGIFDIATVGTTPVVLDTHAGELITPGGTVPLAGTDLTLQLDGHAGPAALIGSADGLITVPLDGSAPDLLPVTTVGGGPIAPVRVGSCNHAAWAGAGGYLESCDGQPSRNVPIPELAVNAELVFRVNRDVVVLNDAHSGSSWLLDADLTLVSNWKEVSPLDDDEVSDDSDDTVSDDPQDTVEQRSETNNPPVAVNDSFGVRPGRTTLLPVLYNDVDMDGDIVTVSLPSDATEALGPVQIVQNGLGLQVLVPDSASAQASFTYDISDGRGGSDSATVSLTVHVPSTNEPPKQLLTTRTTVSLGHEAAVNILSDWRDPDGDPLFLVSAAATTDDSVRFRADGQLTFIDSGTTVARKEVSVVVSDGTTSTTSTVIFDVRASGSAAPVAIADFVTGNVNQAITVFPLTNDTDADDDQLRLASVDPRAGLTITPNYEAQSFTVTAAAADTYYLDYSVSDGPHTSAGIVRLDVIDAAGSDGPPVAVSDIALLPPDQSVLVDVLANDRDPAGGVLVVQSVESVAAPELRVAVLDHHLLRVTAAAARPTAATISYTITNGDKQATAQVEVLPVPAPTQFQPPDAADDAANVRAGDVVTIPVLKNDSQPDGAPLTLDPVLNESPSAGLMFTAGDVLRYLAPQQPGTYTATYTIREPSGQAESARVSVRVTAESVDSNAAPQPQQVVARTFGGAKVRIPIPLSGIDPDGDSVQIVGIDQAPRLGRVTTVGSDWLEYEASPSAQGTDVFSYAVVDRLGSRASAGIRVGVGARPTVDQSPIAVDDVVFARPSRNIQVPVLVNDNDPDGDDLELADVDTPAGVEAQILGADRVQVTTPATAGTISVPYTITDKRGGSSTAYVVVNVSPDAPLAYPVPVDDVVTPDEVAAATDGTINAAVLDNDVDPDGAATDLVVALEGPSPTGATVEGSEVVASVAADRQIVTYSVTDADNQRSYAFVIVPGLNDLPPTLRPDAEIVVESGKTVSIPLADYVRVREGRSPRLTDESKVSGTNASPASLIVDATTLEFTSVAGYAGQASVSAEVTDGTSTIDATGLSAVVTIPITVTPIGNQPPVFAGGSLQVVPGEGAAELSLLTATTDPDPADSGRWTYTIDAAKAATGVTASVTGSTLAVQAVPAVPEGTNFVLPITVADGDNPAVPGSVKVTVVASTRPLAKANDDVVPDANQNELVTVPVLTNDSNPFPDTPLRVVDAIVETGPAGVTLRTDGTTVTVTPPLGLVGTMVVRYRVGDATTSTNREVDGRIRLTVRGKPDQPKPPTVAEVADQKVVLQWQAPLANGTPIIDYRVVSVSGPSFEKICTGTTCDLDGLTNNAEYKFAVSARNEVGESARSNPSGVARPDAIPDAPAAPDAIPQDEQVALTWARPHSNGSQVTSYDVLVSGPVQGPTSRSVDCTDLTCNFVWKGLRNGASYSFTLVAHNRAPDPSEPSSPSRPVVPAGKPFAPKDVTAQRAENEIGKQINVTWQAADGNGAAIDSYRITITSSEPTRIVEAPGGATAKPIDVTNGVEYTFTVAAKNWTGWSADSAPTDPIKTYGRPDPPTNLSTANLDSALQLSFTDGVEDGEPIDHNEVSANGGSWITLDADRVLRGLNNGTHYNVVVRACAEHFCSDPSNVATEGWPFGPLKQLVISTEPSGQQVKFSWDTTTAENGRPMEEICYTINGANQVCVGRGYNEVYVGDGYYKNYYMLMNYRDQAQQTGQSDAGASTGVDPNRRVWLDQGPHHQIPSCWDPSCAYINIHFTGMHPNTRYDFYMDDDSGDGQGGDDWGTGWVITDGNGNGFQQTKYIYGYPGRHIWAAITGPDAVDAPPYTWPSTRVQEDRVGPWWDLWSPQSGSDATTTQTLSSATYAPLGNGSLLRPSSAVGRTSTPPSASAGTYTPMSTIFAAAMFVAARRRKIGAAR